MKMNYKSKKGFATIDLSIAMIVVLMLVVIMTSVSYNIYLSSMEAKRTAVALNYAVDIFEHIGELSFSEVSASYDMFQISALSNPEPAGLSLNEGSGTVSVKVGTYDMTLRIEDYMSSGVVKLITLRIEYPVSRKNTETIELQRVKVIEDT